MLIFRFRFLPNLSGALDSRVWSSHLGTSEWKHLNLYLLESADCSDSLILLYPLLSNLTYPVDPVDTIHYHQETVKLLIKQSQRISSGYQIKRIFSNVYFGECSMAEWRHQNDDVCLLQAIALFRIYTVIAIIFRFKVALLGLLSILPLAFWSTTERSLWSLKADVRMAQIREQLWHSLNFNAKSQLADYQSVTSQ